MSVVFVSVVFFLSFGAGEGRGKGVANGSMIAETHYALPCAARETDHI